MERSIPGYVHLDWGYEEMRVFMYYVLFGRCGDFTLTFVWMTLKFSITKRTDLRQAEIYWIFRMFGDYPFRNLSVFFFIKTLKTDPWTLWCCRIFNTRKSEQRKCFHYTFRTLDPLVWGKLYAVNLLKKFYLQFNRWRDYV